MKLFLSACLAALVLCSTNAHAEIVVFEENFDDASGFTSNIAFFSDGAFDYLGLAGPAENWGGGSAPTGLKQYTGFQGNFLTGMDLDAEGATIPLVVTWTGIDIAGQNGLLFSGDFAEFFDTPGDIDELDSLFVEAQIDGGGFSTILAFTPGGFTSTSGPFNGFFQNGGQNLGDAAQSFSGAIAGAGALLDIRLTVSVDAGDEDFAVDNFRVTAVPEPSSVAFLGLACIGGLLRRRR